MAKEKFYIKSRFAVCSGASFHQTWFQNKKPVGESQFAMIAVGTIAKGRTMKVQYHFTDLDQTGKTGTSGMMITPEVSVPQKWPKTATMRQGGNVPGPQSWAKLKAQTDPGFEHSLTADQGDGSGKEDRIFAVYQPEVKIKFPDAWKVGGAQGGKLFMFAPRWDTAKYLQTKRGGAVFSNVVAMPFSTKTGAPEKAASEHIKQAYTDPDSTKPPNQNKDIPGRTAERPLHRLYHDEGRRKDNRSTAIATCEKYWGKDYPEGKKKQCDEFPFSSTYEGAAQAHKKYDPDGKAPKNNYSAKPIASAENEAGGRLMSSFYTKNRIVDGADDAFLIKVD